MKDPVTGFEYPEEWVKKCTVPELLDRIRQGFLLLTSSGTVLTRGFTTGTTAAAACKAAVLSLKGDVDMVSVRIPCGLVVDVPVEARAGRASCRKFSGDYPSDVTAGIEFVAEAVPVQEGISLVPKTGIGRFSRDTPRYSRGTYAISEPPLACILASVEEALDVTGYTGIVVSLSVPEGERVAERTLNPRVGVNGGISVLGTTGLVEPWDDHLLESVLDRVSAAKNPVLTTGRIGQRYSRLLFPDREVILVGGKIGPALDAASGEVILCGLPALILRYINPRILYDTGYKTVEEFSVSPEFERAVLSTLSTFKKAYPDVRVILINRSGRVVGESP
jgi:cobalt-precorrin-5B (C1)-methyltransferase